MHVWLFIAAFTAGLVLPTASRAGTYRCFDERGQITYSDSPCVSRVPARPQADKIGVISRAHAQGFLTSIDSAWSRLDLTAVLGHLADDAVVHVRVKTKRSGSNITAGKAEFRRVLYKMKHGYWDYRRQRNKLAIKVLADGSQAEVESDVTEWWTEPGGAMTAKSHEFYLVELRSGKPKASVLRIEARGPEPQMRRKR